VDTLLISYSLRTISSFWAYWACNLESLVFEFGSELRSIVVECIKACLVSLFLPRTVSFLGDCNCNNCSSITCIHFGRQSSVAHLTRDVFSGLYGVIAITIPSSVKRIDRDAFGSYSSLRSVHFELPSACWRICALSFTIYHSRLEPITLPSSVEFIDCEDFFPVDHRFPFIVNGRTNAG
jgi:hypothetical protein